MITNEFISFMVLSLCLLAGVFQVIFLSTYWRCIRPQRMVESQVVPTRLAFALHVMQFVVTIVVSMQRITAWVTDAPVTFIPFVWMMVVVANTIIAYLFNQVYSVKLMLASEVKRDLKI